MSKSVHVPQEIKDRVDVEIRRCIEIAEREYNQTFRFPAVVYKIRGRVAGTACQLTYTIDLNSVLLMENLDTFIDGPGTVTHEFAHLVDGIVNPNTRETSIQWTNRGYRRSKRSVHGPTWQRIMRLFGADPSRCHSYDTTNSKMEKRSSSKHIWVCGCGEGKITLTARMHTRQLQIADTGYGRYRRGHTASRCGNYTYRGLSPEWGGFVASKAPLKAASAAPAAPVDLGTLTPFKANQFGLSKTELCIALYKLHYGQRSRSEMIKMFMDELGMTKAGASTYFYNTKKKIAAGA